MNEIIGARASEVIERNAKDLFRPISERVADQLRDLDTTSWVNKIITTHAPDLTPLQQRLHQGKTEDAQGWIDFTAPELPKASPAEVQRAGEARLQEIQEQQLEVLHDTLTLIRQGADSADAALEVSKETLDVTRSNKRAAWIAAILAFLALLATLIFSVAGILR